MRFFKSDKNVGSFCEKLAVNKIRFSVLPGHNDDGEMVNGSLVYTEPKQDSELKSLLGLAPIERHGVLLQA